MILDLVLWSGVFGSGYARSSNGRTSCLNGVS